MLLQIPTETRPETHVNNTVTKSRSQSSDYHYLQVTVRTLHDSVVATLSSFGCWKTGFNQVIFHNRCGTFCGHLFFPCRGASQCFSSGTLSCLVLISSHIIPFISLHFRHDLQFHPLQEGSLENTAQDHTHCSCLLPSANYSQF